MRGKKGACIWGKVCWAHWGLNKWWGWANCNDYNIPTTSRNSMCIPLGISWCLPMPFLWLLGDQDEKFGTDRHGVGDNRDIGEQRNIVDQFKCQMKFFKFSADRTQSATISRKKSWGLTAWPQLYGTPGPAKAARKPSKWPGLAHGLSQARTPLLGV